MKRLAGVTLPSTIQPGATLDMTLEWRAESTPAADYSVFVQLLDAGDANVAQWDGAPYDAVSKLPASAWPAGWRGEHMLELPVPEQLPGGEYRVIAGMYDWQSGTRLPATGAAAGHGDVVHLGTVRVP